MYLSDSWSFLVELEALPGEYPATDQTPPRRKVMKNRELAKVAGRWLKGCPEEGEE